MKRVVVCVAALLAAHVAVADDVAPKPAPEEPKQICTREKPVGTNRPVRICRDAEAAQEAGERTRDAYETVLRNRFNPPELRP